MGTAVFARTVTVNGKTYQPGDRADASGLTEKRFQQMVSLKRIIDSDDELAVKLVPTGGIAAPDPILVADAEGRIIGAAPVGSPFAAEESASPPSGMDEDGLLLCRYEGCDQRLSNERARLVHETKEHSNG